MSVALKRTFSAPSPPWATASAAISARSGATDSGCLRQQILGAVEGGGAVAGEGLYDNAGEVLAEEPRPGTFERLFEARDHVGAFLLLGLYGEVLAYIGRKYLRGGLDQREERGMGFVGGHEEAPCAAFDDAGLNLGAVDRFYLEVNVLFFEYLDNGTKVVLGIDDGDLDKRAFGQLDVVGQEGLRHRGRLFVRVGQPAGQLAAAVGDIPSGRPGTRPGRKGSTSSGTPQNRVCRQNRPQGTRKTLSSSASILYTSCL